MNLLKLPPLHHIHDRIGPHGEPLHLDDESIGTPPPPPPPPPPPKRLGYSSKDVMTMVSLPPYAPQA